MYPMTTSKTQENPPLTLDVVLATFDGMAEQALDTVGARVDAAGLPRELYDQAYAAVAVSLSGIRLALTRFQIRPPLTDSAEQHAFYRVVQQEIDERVSAAIQPLIDQRVAVVLHAEKAFREWNKERPIIAVDKMSHEQWIEIHGLHPEMPGVVKEYGIDGRYTLRERQKGTNQ
jgi:hypothetical protein